VDLRRVDVRLLLQERSERVRVAFHRGVGHRAFAGRGCRRRGDNDDRSAGEDPSNGVHGVMCAHGLGYVSFSSRPVLSPCTSLRTPYRLRTLSSRLPVVTVLRSYATWRLPFSCPLAPPTRMCGTS